MPDETTAALQDIASLLRRRVEQHDESLKRSEERMAKMDAQARTLGLDRMHKQSEQRLSKYTEEAEQRRQQEERQRERLQEEDRQFKQRLIAELERHNLLLERLLSRTS